MRDYSLVGRDGQQAEARGLAGATWYACPLQRKDLKALMQRRDGPAIRDTLIWFAALGLFGGLGFALRGSWAAVPCMLAYGILYGSASDSRWHECGHGTAFRTRWLNDAVYQIACFMVLREPTVWRWSHARHHTDTLIVGRDPEIAAPRPPDLLGLALNLVALKSSGAALRKLAIHAAGRLTAEERTFIPTSEQPKVVWVARLYVALFAAVAAACAAWGTIWPALFVGLPTLYGGGLVIVFGLTQHAGLAEDVLDHRQNSRTVYMNPVFRFLYWNMNYHLDHHMFPMVPYHALPRLHQAIRVDCPPPYRSCWHAYAEILPALLRQRRDPAYHAVRPVPVRAAAAE